MSANTHLPVLHTLDVGSSSGSTNEDHTKGKTKSKKISKTASFLSRLQLGSLQQVALPGDVYYPQVHAKQPRPLGLIPNRNDRLAALKKLNQLFAHRQPQVQHTRPLYNKVSTFTQPQTDSEPAANLGAISATVRVPTEAGAVPLSVKSKHPNYASTDPSTVDPTAYRLPQKSLPQRSLPEANGDPDYMPIADRASEYYTFVGPSLRASAAAQLVVSLPAPLNNQGPGQDKKKAKLKR